MLHSFIFKMLKKGIQYFQNALNRIIDWGKKNNVFK